jgi:hypothetical protein
MSADKHRSLDRRKFLLRRALARGGRLMLNHEGGMAMSNPDLQRLVRDGHMQIKRACPHSDRGLPPKWTKRFRQEVFGRHLHGRTPRTWAYVTDLGRSVL